MKIYSLRLIGFRNKKDETLIPDEKMTIFTGPNGCGKTNILEAMYFASVGKSFRTSVMNDLISFEKSEGTIFIDFSLRGIRHRLKVRLDRKEGAQFFVNDTKIRRKDLVGTFRTVLFTADELRLIKGAPQDRRRFLDLEISQVSPRYYEEMIRYQRAVQQRNAALREAQIRGKTADIDIWDMQIAGGAAYLVKKRTETVTGMNKLLEKTGEILSSGNEKFSIQYMCVKSDNQTVPDMSWYLEKLAMYREEDRKFCQTSVGPHRDDLRFLSNGHDMAHFSSQGQQRTAVLAMKLAEVKYIRQETGEYPILLLDDIGSELDEERKKALFSYLEKTDIQTFVTTTKPMTIQGKEIDCNSGKNE